MLDVTGAVTAGALLVNCAVAPVAHVSVMPQRPRPAWSGKVSGAYRDVSRLSISLQSFEI